MKKFLSILLSALVTVSLAAMVNADDPTECPIMDAPSMDIIANTGSAYDTLEDAAAAIGKTPYLEVTHVIGSEGYSNEGPENLWDNDVTTKFCTSTFPTQSIGKLASPITVDGIILATANDTANYDSRNPFEWTVFVSSDGENWTAIAYGDDTFFENENFMYYAASVTPVENVNYVYFYSEGSLAGCFQISECVLTGTVGATEAEAAVEETVAETEAVVEEAETVAETVVEETVAEETVETVVESAPQTFDMGIIAAAAAVVSLAGYAVAKKH